MKKSTPDIIIGLAVIAWLITLLVQVPSIPEVSRTYPLALIIVSMIMAVFLTVRAALRSRSEEKQPSKVAEQAKVIAPYCVLIIAYLALMPKLGYIISTVAFMVISFLFLKFKKPVAIIAISLIMTILLYFVFTNFLGVVLPEGKWINLSF